jgi:hypothetical protein
LRYGAGLKGKIATSLGYGVPVVGTPIAFEGMRREGFERIFLSVNTVSSLADTIITAYDDRNSWAVLSSLAIDYVKNNYSVNRILPELGKILSIS